MTDSIRIPRAQTADHRGRISSVTPASARWKYVGFEVLELSKGDVQEEQGDARELCLVALEGVIAVSIDCGPWQEVGERTNVFDGPPHAYYIPPGTDYRVGAASDRAQFAICSAPAHDGKLPARHVQPDENPVEIRGEGSMQRTIRPIMMGNQPADSLFVVEVVTPPGLWSSFPPHKHDVDDPPRERYLEETYFHRIRPTDKAVAPAQGYAIQSVYTDGGAAVDEELGSLFQVRDGDTVLIPRGYHPVSAVPGYELYYLNVMAGAQREWLVTLDPSHAWIAPPPVDKSVARAVTGIPDLH